MLHDAVQLAQARSRHRRHYRRPPRRALPILLYHLRSLLPRKDQHRCPPQPLSPGRDTDTDPAAAQGQRVDIDMLRGEIDILRGELSSSRAGGDVSSRTSAPADISSRTSYQTAVSSHTVTDEPPTWSRTSTLESPGQLERSSAAGELHTTESRASIRGGACMNVGHSTHEMNADL